MRITHRPPTGVADGGEIGQVGGPESVRGGRSTSRGDRVELSEAARLRQRLRSEIGDVGGIATEKVAALQSRIAAGYRPDPRAVAERLLADLAADLLA